MPAIIGNMFAASLRTDISRLTRNPFNLNFFLTRLCALMDRRWRLIGYFPILYNPPMRDAIRNTMQVLHNRAGRVDTPAKAELVSAEILRSPHDSYGS
jgi:hypothetical protein